MNECTIIGNGLLASAFYGYGYDFQGCVIFTSGVSSSTETDDKAFIRERDLLIKTIADLNGRKLIYFSSILTSISSKKYYTHKSDMESIITHSAMDYLIIRLPQVIGFGGNRTNLLNTLVTYIKSGSEIHTTDSATRSLIDVNDVVSVTKECAKMVHNKILNFSHIEKLKVIDIISIIENELNIKANVVYNKEEKYDNWDVVNSDVIDIIIHLLGISNLNYTEKIIKKYITW